jgi:hypothetical protein
VKRDDVEYLLRQVRLLADGVAGTHEGMEAAFAEERHAEQSLLIQLLDAMRPAFPWLADQQGPVLELPGEREYWQVTLDADSKGTWLACDHPELGLVVARRPDHQTPHRVWPGGQLPSGREGGPRLGKMLDGLMDRLAGQATGNSARRRREASAMAERLRAVQTLLRAP